MRSNHKLWIVIWIVSIVFFTQTFYGDEKNAANSSIDILIKNAKIFDGSFKNPFQADIAIKGDTIVEVSPSIHKKARKVIDAEGLYLSPGFIDLHTHVDRGMYFPENRACLNYLKQGVTSVVVGQCGRSAWPIFEEGEDQMSRWTEEGIGPNAAFLIGHGQVREMVMEMEEREPTSEELEEMKAIVKKAMEQGASGLSTGLEYEPGEFGKTDEIIELVKVIASYGGIYHTHMRSESDKLLEAVEEAIEIAKQSGASAHISHFKAVRKKNWGLVKEACELIEKARKEGIQITADQYPYRFSSGYPYRTLIPRPLWIGEEKTEILKSSDLDEIFDHLRDSQLVDLYKKVTPYYPISESHQEFLDGLSRKRLVQYVRSHFLSTGYFQGPSNTRERMFFIKRMNNPEEAEKIREEVKEYIDDMAGAENVIVGICVEKTYEGKSLKQIAEMEGKSVADTAIKLELMGAKCVPLRMCEEDIEYIMKKNYVGTGSDGTAPFYGIGLCHIRSYSAFLHKIKKYALQRKTVSVPHVVRSQTSLAADIMNWKDRGLIKEGYKADINIFDLDNIVINTSISNPHQYSEGVKYLIINGEIVLDNEQYTGKLPGRVLKLKKRQSMN